MMFLKAATGKDLNDQIIRLSPLIHYDVHTPKEIVPLVKDLYLLDMDLTKDEEIDKLITCFIAWKNGDIYNQPIEFRVERSNDLLFLKGDKWYKDGMERWIKWEL
ncbi:MAG: hypothetical protein ABJ300_16940 [Maribacter dokdonensis]